MDPIILDAPEATNRGILGFAQLRGQRYGVIEDDPASYPDIATALAEAILRWALIREF